jgi:hypothetical protein
VLPAKLTTALVIAAGMLPAGAQAATFQDLRSPDTRDASEPRPQDLRTPDARDASLVPRSSKGSQARRGAAPC